MSKHQIRKLAGMTLLLGFVFLPMAHASHTFIAVLNNPQKAGDSAIHGYAQLTLGENDLLCYSVSLRGEIGPTLVIRFLHGGLSIEMDRASHQLTGSSTATVSGCVGPLSPDEKRDLLNQQFYLHLLNDAFPEGEIGGAAARVAAAVSAETEAWLGLAQLLDLDDRQWMLVEQMVQFQPSDWERLAVSLKRKARGEESPGVARPAGRGTISVGLIPTPIDLGDLTLDQLKAELAPITGLVEEIRNLVTTAGADDSRLSVLKGVNLTRGVVALGADAPFSNLDANDAIEAIDELLRQGLSDANVIKTWVDEIQTSPLAGTLEDLQPLLLESIDDTLETLRFFRNSFGQGFDQFVAPNDCGPGSQCDSFKMELLNILTQLKTLAGDTPRLVGLETEFPIETNLLAQFVAHTPPLVLFLVKSVADEVLPQWLGFFDEIQMLVQDFQGGASPLSTMQPARHRNPVDHLCVGVFKREKQFARLVTILGLVKGVLQIVGEAVCPQTLVIGLTVEAGATVNPAPHPCRAHIKLNEFLVGFIETALSNFRQRCVFDQQRAVSIYEPHLQECNQLVGLFVPVENGGHLEELRNLIEFRSLQTVTSDRFSVVDALGRYQQHLVAGEFRVAYCCLCEAYGAILTATGGTGNSCECP